LEGEKKKPLKSKKKSLKAPKPVESNWVVYLRQLAFPSDLSGGFDAQGSREMMPCVLWLFPEGVPSPHRTHCLLRHCLLSRDWRPDVILGTGTVRERREERPL